MLATDHTPHERSWQLSWDGEFYFACYKSFELLDYVSYKY